MNIVTVTNEHLIETYFTRGRVMQLATIHAGRPWICSVYYVCQNGQLYWLSWPSRQHSQDIAANSEVAAAIVIQASRPVIGLQVEGQVAVVNDHAEVAQVMERYVTTHGAGKRFYDNFVAGTNQHVMYRLMPRRIAVFDQKCFGDYARELLGTPPE